MALTKMSRENIKKVKHGDLNICLSFVPSTLQIRGKKGQHSKAKNMVSQHKKSKRIKRMQKMTAFT